VPLYAASTAIGAAHAPAKNVMPVTGVRDLPPNVALMVDFAPREAFDERLARRAGRRPERPPLMVAMDMRTGEALKRWTLRLSPPCSALASEGWRGSTQLVPLRDARSSARNIWHGAPRRIRGLRILSAPFDEHLWVALVHRGSHRPPRYNFSLVVIASTPTSVPWSHTTTRRADQPVLVPTVCVHMLPVPLPGSRRLPETPAFAFAAGLAPLGPAPYSGPISQQPTSPLSADGPRALATSAGGWDLLVSWGLEDRWPAISRLRLHTPPISPVGRQPDLLGRGVA